MSDRDAFIRAICARPADDTVRLIFADWLDENGVASDRIRANFIRRQVAGEVASVPLTLATELEPYLNGRPCHGYLANNGWPGYAELRYREAVFFYRRGFVDEVRCPLNVFLAHAEELFRNHPIAVVRLVDVEPMQFDELLFWVGLPPELASELLGEPDAGYPQEGVSAADALSIAAVRCGRRKAGLPVTDRICV